MDGQRITALYREVNCSMTQLLHDYGAYEAAEFFCECPQRDCARRVALTRVEYERIRAAGGFLVSAECERWPGEVRRTARYAVVMEFRPRRLQAVPSPSPRAPSRPAPSRPAPSRSAPSSPGSSPQASSEPAP